MEQEVTNSNSKEEIMEYYVPLTSPPVDLADGRTVAPGETVELKAKEADEAHNAALIESQQLLKVSGEKGGE
jgi:hypothetical protein